MRKLTARESALKILNRIDNGAYVDKVLESHLSKNGLSNIDEAFVRKLVLGVVKWRGRLDWILERYLTKGSERLTPTIKNILRLGIYQVLFLDKVPSWAAVDEAVKLADRYGHRGAKGLVNAVLRRVAREGDPAEYPDIATEPARYLSVYYSHPLWLVKRWVKRYGVARTAELCEFNNAQPRIFIRTNTLKITPEKLVRMLEAEGFNARPNHFLPEFLELESAAGIFKTQCFLKGYFQVQDLSAGVAVRLLAPQPGERVLDLCSAPGGKTTYMAEIMRDRGTILALDRHQGRLKTLQENIKRLGIHIVQVEAKDALSFTSEPFDRVLVDVPCSGTGTLCRRADARWKIQERMEELTALQLALLNKGAKLLKPKGVLVYSTCSIEPEENEMVVEDFLRANPQFRLEIPALGFPFLTDKYVETFPPRDHCDGSFAARIRRLE